MPARLSPAGPHPPPTARRLVLAFFGLNAVSASLNVLVGTIALPTEDTQFSRHDVLNFALFAAVVLIELPVAVKLISAAVRDGLRDEAPRTPARAAALSAVALFGLPAGTAPAS